MNDTSPEFSKLYTSMLMNLSAEERFIRGAQMFDSVRTMIMASLDKNISEKDIKKNLFRRLYQNDFNEKELAEIIPNL
jgi:hypothetical protein